MGAPGCEVMPFLCYSAETHLRPFKPVTWKPTLPMSSGCKGKWWASHPPIWDRFLLEAELTWGTHFGETKLVASITGSPASESMSISLIFTGVGTMFCNRQKPRKGKSATSVPKHGPTVRTSASSLHCASSSLWCPQTLT